MSEHLHVIIVGGGFAGLEAAKALKRSAVRITLVDRRNHHLFQPLLYQVATAGLSPADIAEPIRRILRRQRNVRVMLGQAHEVDLAGRRLRVDDAWLAWDRLIVATGSSHAYFGHDEWAEHAPGLKTVGDALDIRQRVLLAYEQAEWTEDPEERRRLMTFVVVGGGPTGVELAGALAEIATRTLARDFRNIDTATTRIVLVEASDSVLRAYPEDLRARALVQLDRIGVEVRLDSPVKAIDARGADIGEDGRIDAGMVLWAAGVEASPLGKALGVPLDRAGRVPVAADLSVVDHPEAFVVGDLAAFAPDAGAPLPQLAPVAVQMGRHAAACIRADLAGRPRAPFHFRDLGTMATIGRSKAIAEIFGLHLSGFVAWLVWVFVHIMTLVGFRNRQVVFVKWFWAYLTWDRGSRLVWQGERSRAGVLVRGGIDLDESTVQDPRERSSA